LRALQEQEFERLGGRRTIHVDFRLVAATNRDLGQMVEQGRFRNDLYYRINVFPIQIPPLRHRSADIPKLAWHFAKMYAKRMNKRIEKIRAEDLAVLAGYSWPGNIRELQNFIERSVILSTNTILYMPIEEFNRAKSPAKAGMRTLAEAEREHILETLRETEWVVGGPHGASTILDVKRTTLLDKMRRLGISRPLADG
jgi:formate hydrogenlyase transcriptional activator